MVDVGLWGQLLLNPLGLSPVVAIVHGLPPKLPVTLPRFVVPVVVIRVGLLLLGLPIVPPWICNAL